MYLNEVAIILIALIVPQQQQVAMAADGCQQVVEIMRDPARELADRLHLLALHELGFKGLQLGLVASCSTATRMVSPSSRTVVSDI